MITIGGISDLHGIFPNTETWPQFDIFIIAGDVLTDYDYPMSTVLSLQKDEVSILLNPWLLSIKTKKILLCWGNHDHFGYNHNHWCQDNISAIVVENDTVDVDGLKIYLNSYSYQPPDYPKAWSFGKSEAELNLLYEQIPQNIDILVSHTPPYGALDLGFGGTKNGMNNFGSISLRRWLENNRLPKLQHMLVGHIHEWGGRDFYYRWSEDRGFTIHSVCADPLFNLHQKPCIFSMENNK